MSRSSRSEACTAGLAEVELQPDPGAPERVDPSLVLGRDAAAGAAFLDHDVGDLVRPCRFAGWRFPRRRAHRRLRGRGRPRVRHSGRFHHPHCHRCSHRQGQHTRADGVHEQRRPDLGRLLGVHPGEPAHDPTRSRSDPSWAVPSQPNRFRPPPLRASIPPKLRVRLTLSGPFRRLSGQARGRRVMASGAKDCDTGIISRTLMFTRSGRVATQCTASATSSGSSGSAPS